VSYIFHVWEHPRGGRPPANPEQASQFITVASNIETDLNPKYIAFAKAITARYPDLESMPDTGDDSDMGVWTDSPIDGKTECAIYAIGVLSDRLELDLLWSIVHAAYDQGLHVFDMQSASLFFPDWTYVNGEGKLHISRLERFDRPEMAWETPEGCVAKSIGCKTIKEAAEQVVEVIPRFHAPADFMPFVPEIVKNRAREMVETLPAYADDLPILHSAWFDSTGMTKEQIAERRESVQRSRKQQIFDAATAVHRYFHG
jgi:hypothetical protein